MRKRDFEKRRQASTKDNNGRKESQARCEELQRELVCLRMVPGSERERYEVFRLLGEETRKLCDSRVLKVFEYIYQYAGVIIHLESEDRELAYLFHQLISLLHSFCDQRAVEAIQNLLTISQVTFGMFDLKAHEIIGTTMNFSKTVPARMNTEEVFH